MKDEPSVLWERTTPRARPTPVTLDRESIVQAALELADTQGLDAVSLRNVAGALGAGPMRLYGYVDSKDDLLELLVDHVYGEMMQVGPIKGAWRVALREVAHRIRHAARAHPWFVGLLAGRPHVGPHALAHLEAALAALMRSQHFADIDGALGALRVVSAYVIGALESSASELRTPKQKLDEERRAMWPYLQRTLATGLYPTVARLVHEAAHPNADDIFESGLHCVLDGIELGARKRRR